MSLHGVGASAEDTWDPSKSRVRSGSFTSPAVENYLQVLVFKQVLLSDGPAIVTLRKSAARAHLMPTVTLQKHSEAKAIGDIFKDAHQTVP